MKLRNENKSKNCHYYLEMKEECVLYFLTTSEIFKDLSWCWEIDVYVVVQEGLHSSSLKIHYYTFGAPEAGSLQISSAFCGFFVFLSHLLLIEWTVHSMYTTGEQLSFVKLKPSQDQHLFHTHTSPLRWKKK